MKTDTVYPHPIERVWAALTSAEALAAWFVPNDFVAEVGHEFSFTTRPRPGFDGPPGSTTSGSARRSCRSPAPTPTPPTDLTAKGVTPNTGVDDAPWGRWFSADDPDGNNWLFVAAR
jgi:hypothetical protein